MEKLLFMFHFPLGQHAGLLQNYDLVRPAKPLEYFSREELMERIGDATGLICFAGHPSDREMLAAGKKLKAIGNVAVGFNNIDIAAATERGIRVINTPHEVTEATAELTIALMMDIARSISRFDRDLRAARKWTSVMLFERDMLLTGKTLGILGFGRIGRCVAKKAALGLNMKIIYHDVVRAPIELEKEVNATFLPVEEVLKQADAVTLHMPYTPENHHFINSERLALMKPTAYLINAARGSIVSEQALIAALKTNAIRGAALDVHEKEPTISAEIAALENVVLTPHVGTNLAEVRTNMFLEMLQGVLAVLRGEIPYNVVNRF
jgi:lactate dehydrogenase-like 2-hydroxyacid dehydrogenase